MYPPIPTTANISPKQAEDVSNFRSLRGIVADVRERTALKLNIVGKHRWGNSWISTQPEKFPQVREE